MITILRGDVRSVLASMQAESVDITVTSPPYWGLRDYGVEGQIGLEPTLGEHLDVMVDVFRAVRRVLKPEGTLWLNYGDCYATTPNGRTAAAMKAVGTDDRTFRDKPFSTIGPIRAEGDRAHNLGNTASDGVRRSFVGQGVLKAKDLCMIPNRLAIALQEDGWWVRSEIIWGKPNPMPDSSGRYRPSTAHEKIFLLTKSAKSFYDSEAVRMPASMSSIERWQQDIDAQSGSLRANSGAKTNGPLKAVGGPRLDKQRGHSRRHEGFNDRWDNMSKEEQCSGTRLLRNYEPAPVDVWPMATRSFSEAHFATFPPELAERCIRAGCPIGGHVLDPFGGAGTTGLVADRLGCEATLIELNPEYIEIARRRIAGDAPLLTSVRS